VNGDPSHVGGTDDAPDQEGGAELLPAMFELVTQYPRRQRVSTNPAAIAFTLIVASSTAAFAAMAGAGTRRG
jgi:hypothetical protein